jgi:DDE superfamily endonuclease
MWTMIESLRPLVDGLAPAFTGPSLTTCTSLFLAWVMCLRHKTLFRVGENAHPDILPDHSKRHGMDGFYNFFERSSWSAADLGRRVGILILSRLKFCGAVTLLVDDTLTHKAGKCVWGMGWFRDAVASTRKRVATAPGHNWVVIAIAFCNPVTGNPVFAFPLLAALHEPGKGNPSCPVLARQMLETILEWYPNRHFILVGDGAYAAKELLKDLPDRVTFVGRLRGDAAVYNPKVPQPKTKKRGRKAKKGPRLPSPKEAVKKADRKRTDKGAWLWQLVSVCVYGETRELNTVSYEALWPRVLGLRSIQIVGVRDPSGTMDDIYLFTTDVRACPSWVITQFAWRWSIEVLFRASKQVMDIEAPQHWCQASVQKLAPWVWSMQSVIMVWYITEGHQLPEAKEMTARMGPWDSQWSLRHMIQVMRRATLNATFDINSAKEADLRKMTQTLENWALLAG